MAYIKRWSTINTIEDKIKLQQLLKIKRIVDKDKNGDSFIILRRSKNIEFMQEYNLNLEDIKNIIRSLSIEDYYEGPVKDRDSQYDGWISIFAPWFEETKLYIKIRVESTEKSICISVHEFGKYDEVK